MGHVKWTLGLWPGRINIMTPTEDPSFLFANKNIKMGTFTENKKKRGKFCPRPPSQSEGNREGWTKSSLSEQHFTLWATGPHMALGTNSMEKLCSFGLVYTVSDTPDFMGQYTLGNFWSVCTTKFWEPLELCRVSNCLQICAKSEKAFVVKISSWFGKMFGKSEKCLDGTWMVQLLALNHKLMEAAHGLWFQNVALDNVSSLLRAVLVCSYQQWHGAAAWKLHWVKLHMFRAKQECYPN